MILIAGPSTFAPLDWTVLGVYLAIVTIVGLLAARKRSASNDFFLGGRAIPMWAVAISVLATAQSAATFVGGPQQSYAGDLTYLSANLGPLIAAFIVAFVFIPAFYRHNVTSIYELLGHEMGTKAQRVASGMFMLGRVFASGARLYIVAIPFAMVAFGGGEIEPIHLIASIIIITVVAALYSIAGGIRAVIWTDVMQTVVYLGCLAIALLLIWQKIPLSPGEMIDVLRNDGEDGKLRVIDLSLDFTKDFTLWTALLGLMLLNLAAYGTDQDLTQRMLTCKSPRQASWSVISATLIAWPVVFMFLAMGLLLYIYYQRPDVMGDAAPAMAAQGSQRVFIDFILHEMHPGLRGLMMAGLFAAAMSSMDSGLNAMSSTTIADFYRPWRRQRDSSYTEGDAGERRAARFASMGWAIAIATFACICIAWQQAANQTLIGFALGVMTFAYSGLLGVFFTALLTKRGNAASAVAAMAVGFATVLLLDPIVQQRLPAALQMEMSFSWRLLIAATLSTMTCMVGERAAVAARY